MEGGNKININLEAGLDISSSDMLVPIGQHTFQHNWQKYQGKFLPNSLRFEKNGWAAGWNVYNFKYNTYRVKLANGVYVEPGQYNSYVKTLTVYDSEGSEDDKATIYLATDPAVISGDVTIQDNIITGNLSGDQFQIQWDSTTHTGTVITPGFRLRQTDNLDKSITFKVISDRSIRMTFDLVNCSDLTSDVISAQKFSSQTPMEATWGSYTYDFSTNKVSTPEGILADCTLQGNQLTFNYDVNITDEHYDLQYMIEPLYYMFSDIEVDSDSVTKGMIDSSANSNLAFNKYNMSVSFKPVKYFGTTILRSRYDDNDDKWEEWLVFGTKSDLLGRRIDGSRWYSKCIHEGKVYHSAPTPSGSSMEEIRANVPGYADPNIRWVYMSMPREQTNNNTIYESFFPNVMPYIYAADAYGAIVTMQVPVWFSTKIAVTKPTLTAKYCNNTLNSEVALSIGTGINNRIKIVNAYTQQTSIEALLDNYRTRDTTPQYIMTMTNRFNEILPYNTIEPSTKWSPFMFTLTADDVWIGNMRRFENMRMRRTAVMQKYMGSHCTIKSLTYKASAFFEQNNIWDWTTVDNAVYVNPDISGILSIKLAGTPDNEDTGDDEDFVTDNIPDFDTLCRDYIADFIDTSEYNPVTSLLTSYEYDEVYDATGTYIGNSYDSVGTSESWPFAKVPRFNFKDSNGDVHRGIYWTDGNVIIDDLMTFQAMVLGEYDVSQDLNNSVLIKNKAYSRQRLVKTYTACFDFDMPTKAQYPDANTYTTAVKAFDTVWEKIYPELQSPTALFLETDSAYDSTYMDYVDITVESNCIPNIQFVKPGVYCFGRYAVPYNHSSGIVLYNETDIFTGSAEMYHQSLDTKSLYNFTFQHNIGSLTYDGDTVQLPYYFGAATKLSLSMGAGDQNSFKQRTQSVDVTSASINIGITGNNDAAWARNISVKYSNNKTVVSELSSRIGTPVNTYTDANIEDGIRIGMCFKGKLMSRLTYPKAMTKSKLTQDPASAFTFEPLPDSALPNTTDLYLDRTVNAYSYNWFSFSMSDIDTGTSENKGSMNIALKPVDGIPLYYSSAETIAKAYLPPVLYDEDTESTNALLTSTAYPQVALKFKPNTYNILVDVQTSFSKSNTLGCVHRLYTNDIYKISSLTASVGDANNGVQDITLYVNGVTLKLQYNYTLSKTTPVDLYRTILQLDSSVAAVDTFTDNTDSISIGLNILLHYTNCTAKLYAIKQDTFTIEAADAENITVVFGENKLVYNKVSQIAAYPKCDLEVTPNEDGSIHIDAEQNIEMSCVAVMPFTTRGTVDGQTVTFDYAGNVCTFDFSSIDMSKVGISVLSTDIRKPNKTVNIGLIKPEGQYQLLRQQWNTTVEVENYWWVDSTHVLELTSDKFTLKRNTNELDDWNGNRFEPIYSVNRDNVIDSSVTTYFVTNTFNTMSEALFVVIKEYAGDIWVYVYSPRKEMKQLGSVRFQIRNRQLGQELNDITVDGSTGYFNTYSPLSVTGILSVAKWSNTLIGNRLIIGCSVNKNLNQWSAVIDTDNYTVDKVIQGYGFVAVDGSLTGGMLPNDFMDPAKGFNSTVQPLTVLGSSPTDLGNLDAAYEVGSIDNLNKIDAKVVGTAERQWYIRNRLYGIVSHLTFSNGNFTKQLIPITNNYAAVYKSPSFSSSILGDGMVQAIPFQSMFKFDGAAQTAWTTVMAVLGWPFMFVLAPRYSQFAYLQQTIGQYAYVHYNSSEDLDPEFSAQYDIDPMKNAEGSGVKKVNHQPDPRLSGYMTFDKQKFTQHLTTSFTFYDAGILAALIIGMSASIDAAQTQQSVNAENLTTAVNDKGKKYTSIAVENVGDMVGSKITTHSKSNTGITSTVTGIKSVDMFYSTSDKQRVWAGPGFVEHQFVADCTAQSVTDVTVEGKTLQLFFCIKDLTTTQTILTVATEELAANFLDQQGTNLENTTVTVFGNGTSLAPAAVVLHASAAALRAAIVAQKRAAEAVNGILDVVCAQGITSTVDSVISNSNLSCEANHKYGEKNETFMWPCWGISSGQLKYTDEYVACGVKNTPWQLNLVSRSYYTATPTNAVNPILDITVPKYSSNKATKELMFNKAGGSDVSPWNGKYMDQDSVEGDNYRAYMHRGNVPYYQASAYGIVTERTLPDDMAKVEGVSRFLPNEPFKNENCGLGDPAFAPSLIQDYIIDKRWDLGQCATYAAQQWVTVKDTKITNCPPSNIVVNESFCGVACSYAAIEVKRGIRKAYMRPWAITPNTLAFNTTGYNCILDNRLYHAFDGISYRLVDLVGAPGLDKNRQSLWYSFQVNDRFKRSNIAPANEMLGNFEADPVQSVDTIDNVWSIVTTSSKEKGLQAGTVGEDKDATRWAIPIFTEQVSLLPAAVKTMAASTLAVSEGITCLVTKQVTDTNSAYKAPLSVDFTIGKKVFRATEEYISSVTPAAAGNKYEDITPILGLTFIGSTPNEAFFYSKATRCYYVFNGASLAKMDMMERFRDVQKGYWDFVNQEVVVPCLMTFKRLNPEVLDKDTETDNVIVPVMSGSTVSGELPPPITTVFNDRSWYKIVSLPAGLAYQGPNRVIINRAVFVEYMLDSLKANLGKWTKMNRESYVTHRTYPETYTDVMTDVHGVDGWTYNPFVLVTSALGTDEDTDCMFEWTITFCWPIEMDLIYNVDNFAVVNISADTMTPGGRIRTRPTHIFLTKELFTRSGNYGYYSTTFNSNNGAGNRERLHIWSDQYIAISSITCSYKKVTDRRQTPLTQQTDIISLKEL